MAIWRQPDNHSHHSRPRSHLLLHKVSEKIQVGLQTICDIIQGIERVKQSIGKGVIKSHHKTIWYLPCKNLLVSSMKPF
jgi:hypothetical protein